MVTPAVGSAIQFGWDADSPKRRLTPRLSDATRSWWPERRSPMQGFGKPEPVGISLTTLKLRLSTVNVVPETIPVRAPTTRLLTGGSGRTSLFVASTTPALLRTALNVGPLVHSLSLRCVLVALKRIWVAIG